MYISPNFSIIFCTGKSSFTFSISIDMPTILLNHLKNKHLQKFDHFAKKPIVKCKSQMLIKTKNKQNAGIKA